MTHHKEESAMTLIILGGITLLFLGISTLRSKEKTRTSLKQAFAMGKGMLPEILGILLFISLLLAVLDKDTIQRLLGTDSSLINTVMGSLIGAVTIVPGIIAFPLSKELLAAGAAPLAIAAFITTLTMVGIATSPLERSQLGLRFTLARNGLSLVFAVMIALLMGVLL